jgi:uncharacterized membrane protein
MRSLSFLLVGACSCASLASTNIEVVPIPGRMGFIRDGVLLNNRGDIVVRKIRPFGGGLTTEIVVWADGETDIVRIGDGTSSFYGINDSGLLVFKADPQAIADRDLYYWRRGNNWELAAEFPESSSTSSTSRGVSADGTTVFGADLRLHRMNPDGSIENTGPSSVGPSAINVHNTVVGRYYSSLPGRMFVLEADGSLRTQASGFSNVSPSDLNDYGIAVGWRGDGNAWEGAGFTAFRWDTATTTVEAIETLPDALGSDANAINNRGWIVGNAYYVDPSDKDNEISRPFFWTERTGAVDLQSLLGENSGWQLFTATDINDAGVVVGRALFNGEYVVYRMTVPAPASALPLAALGMFAARRRR